MKKYRISWLKDGLPAGSDPQLWEDFEWATRFAAYLNSQYSKQGYKYFVTPETV